MYLAKIKKNQEKSGIYTNASLSLQKVTEKKCEYLSVRKQQLYSGLFRKIQKYSGSFWKIQEYS